MNRHKKKQTSSLQRSGSFKSMLKQLIAIDHRLGINGDLISVVGEQ